MGNFGLKGASSIKWEQQRLGPPPLLGVMVPSLGGVGGAVANLIFVTSCEIKALAGGGELWERVEMPVINTVID